MNSSLCFFLWTIFGLQHSILARPFFKKKVKTILGEKFQLHFYPFIYFISQCIIFVLIYDLIRNLKPSIIFFSAPPEGEFILYFLNRIANIFLIITVFHFDIGLFTGITQMFDFFSNSDETKNKEQIINTNFLYKYIRHPMYLGIVLVYITSSTIYSDLFFANLFSIIFYIDIGSYFEEKTLVRKFGKSYNYYKTQTKKFLPLIR
ncbi:hypothetical protein HA152_07505 [Prochlorococcus marinus XMU1412]|uniref:methyltransferase family protein n=1 Tax=Prochlorococcus marinus TaxID=1219 RepID=UPI001AD9BD84|nr:methyltransferase [Prochlorococcus marinus]MBO8240548.1 hypothetical protein [Prochlorococcus marinus XMU1412]